jgi:CheY-like chemotaxis protein
MRTVPCISVSDFAAKKLTENAIRPYQGAGAGLLSVDFVMPRVLVVDDDPLVCATIEVFLQRQGFEVTLADGGEQGLSALESSTFDLMLVDIFMPHMRGFESIRIFHERAPAIPLIAMSGYAFVATASPSPDFLRMALELGATCCLRKPFTPEALLSVVNECLTKAAPNAQRST